MLNRLFRDERIGELLSEAALVRRMVEVEVALARAEAAVGVIPADAAREIEARASSWAPDAAGLIEGVARSGVPVPALVEQLRERVGGDARRYVHWGATSQDIMDTALVLQLREALDLLEDTIRDVVATMAALAREHRGTLMCGRTHAQVALPITFGYKVARWLVPLVAHLDRLAELRPRLLVVQLGGGAGTLASLGGSGAEVEAELARELDLGVPLAPWHTQRDGLVELAGWLSLVTGSLAKMAQDVILMVQSEVAELAESGDAGRGGSSTMPQKSNPVRSELLVAAARHNATLVSGMHHALVQEHERGTHGWQMEWLTLPQMVDCTGGALANALALVQDLVVRSDRMARNVGATHGVMLAEAASLLLSEHREREEAERVVKEAAGRATETGKHIVEILEEVVSPPIDWSTVREEANYLGATQSLLDRVLERADGVRRE